MQIYFYVYTTTLDATTLDATTLDVSLLMSDIKVK